MKYSGHTTYKKIEQFERFILPINYLIVLNLQRFFFLAGDYETVLTKWQEK